MISKNKFMKTDKINEKTRFSPEVESILFSIRQAILKLKMIIVMTLKS